MGVLDACHSAGLVVVATVCDTGANSVKAKKQQLDVSEKAPFIRFQYQNTATLFDPPHLLQCTHSHFPKHYIVNVGCGITVSNLLVQLQDIRKQHKIDKQNVLYHLLTSVMDRHLNWCSIL